MKKVSLAQVVIVFSLAVQQEPVYSKTICIWSHWSSETESRQFPSRKCHNWEGCNVYQINSADYHFLSQITLQPFCTWVKKRQKSNDTVITIQMVVKGIFYLHHLVSDFRSVPAEPGEVAKDFPHTPILLCRLLDRACDNQQCLLYP